MYLTALRYPSVLLYLLSSRAHWAPRAKTIVGQLDLLCAEIRVRRVIDIGCGPGLLVTEVTRRGLTYFGCDIHKSSIIYCRTNWRDSKVTFSEGSVYMVGWRPEKTDVVVVNGVIHHLEETELRRLVQWCSSAAAMIVADHLFEPGVTGRLVQLAQRLDRGKFVRPRTAIADVLGTASAYEGYPITLFGIHLWDYFTATHRR
jgi:SAM-dependent methyltransferase